jgi:hypothetical protein
VADNPLDEIFDCLSECAAVLDDYSAAIIAEAQALDRVRGELSGVGVPVDAAIGWLRIAQKAVLDCREVLAEIDAGLPLPDGLRVIRDVNADRLLIAMHESGYIHRLTQPPAGLGY